LEDSKIKLKHCPVVAIIKIPEKVESVGRFIGNYIPENEKFYQEIRLVPGNVRTRFYNTPSITYFCEYEKRMFKSRLEENGGIERFKKYVLNDMLSLLELIPRTVEEVGYGTYKAYTISCGASFEKDWIVAPTGLYFADMESVGYEMGFEKIIEELNFHVPRVICGIQEIFLRLELGNSEEVLQEIIEKIDSSKYLKIEKIGKLYLRSVVSIDVEGENGFRTKIKELYL
jgi:hypothetical protein